MDSKSQDTLLESYACVVDDLIAEDLFFNFYYIMIKFALTLNGMTLPEFGGGIKWIY